MHERERAEVRGLFGRHDQVGQRVGADVTQRDAVAGVTTGGAHTAGEVDVDEGELVTRHGQWASPTVRDGGVKCREEIVQ